MIATLPAEKVRYKEFQKNGTKFYMPCPSEIQIRLMGTTYRKILKAFPSDTEIMRRVKDMGPFIRSALIDNESERGRFLQERNASIGNLVQSDFEELQTTIHVENKMGLSHRLAKYVVDYMEPNLMKRYGDRVFTLSSEMIESEIVKTIWLLCEDKVKRDHHLINKLGVISRVSIPKHLKLVL
jgi:transcription elongation factor GreA-like protein